MAGADQKVIDLYLVDRILRRNDQLAYATLMNKYKKAVYFTVLKMVSNKDDAEDLTMQAFTKAFKSLDNTIIVTHFLPGYFVLPVIALLTIFVSVDWLLPHWMSVSMMMMVKVERR